MKREDKIRHRPGKLIALKIKIPEFREIRKVLRKRSGEVVEAEAEGAESGQARERIGGESTEERGAGEAENGDAVVLTDNTLPVAWASEGGVPKEGAAADGRAKGQESGPVGGQI